MKKKHRIERFLKEASERASVGGGDDDEDEDGIVDASLAGCRESLLLQDAVQVNCNSVLGQLHKKRFGSGSKGSCIRVAAEDLPGVDAGGSGRTGGGQDAWMTPIEFENFCGKGSCRDWKRSIKVGGQPLAKLIDENILICHAISCTCAICNDNEKLTGPIKPFLKAKRRNANEIRQAYDKFLSLKPPSFLKSSLVQKLSKLERLSGERTRPSAAEMIARIEKQEREQWEHVEKALSNVAESVRSLEALVKQSREKSESNMRRVLEIIDSTNERSESERPSSDDLAERLHQRVQQQQQQRPPLGARASGTSLLIRKIQKKYSRCREKNRAFT